MIDFDQLINEAAKVEGGEKKIEQLTNARKFYLELKEEVENKTKELKELKEKSHRDEIALEEIRKINGLLLANMNVAKGMETMSPEKYENMFKFQG